ncbi:MAG: PQQ-binding-like beta-propeller repeat protein [Verrucomicrobiota bacterium]
MLLPIAVQAGDWPQWRGPNRDGAWNETGIMESFPPGGLKISWRAPVGRGWSSPVVAQGRVYITDVELVGPTARERVLCFAEATGKLLWSHRYAVDYPDWAFDPNAGGPRATPIIRDGKLFTLGALDHLFCLDAVRGEVVWQKNLAKEYQVKEFTGITASPLIEDELLILQICAKPAACVVAFDKNSGKEAWKALDDSFLSNTSTALLRGEHAFSAKTSGELVCLEAGTGKEVWQTNTVTSLKNGSSIHLTPNGDSVLLFTDQGNLIRARLSSAGYRELSRVHLLDPTYPFNGRNVVWPPPAYAHRHVFARNDKELICALLAAEP